MASVSSHNSSSHPSPYDFDSNGDTDESWQYIDYSSGGSAPGSVGFLPSPASGSLNGFAIVGHNAMMSPSQPSQPSMSLKSLGVPREDPLDSKRRSVFLKQANFTKRHGRRHHGFDKEKAPYPLSFDRTALDLCVLYPTT